MGTKTIKSSGGDYTSLSAWESANQADITGLGPSIAECYDVDDTTTTTLNGWTTTASDYIEIIAATAARCNGSTREQTGDTYRLSGTNSTGQLRIAENFVRVEGIECRGNAAHGALQITSTTGTTDIRVLDCVLISNDSTASNSYAVLANVSGSTSSFTNCLINGKRRGINTSGSTAVTIDHCTFYGDGAGLGVVHGSELACTNTYAGGYTSEDFYTGSGAGTGSHNASADTTATTDYTSSLISKAATDQFVSPSLVDSTFDFSLKSGNALEGAGTGSVTNDIAGNPYGSPSDIGCFAPVSGSTYTLSADPTGYTLGSDNAELQYDQIMTATATSYTLGSDNVNLTYTPAGSYTLTATATAYSLGSDNVNLEFDTYLAADATAYTLGSDNVNLTYEPIGASTLNADPTAYTLGSDSVNLVFDTILSAEPTAYTLTFSDADLILGVLDTPNCFTWVTSEIEPYEYLHSIIDDSATYVASTINNDVEYVQSLIDDSVIYVKSELCACP